MSPLSAREQATRDRVESLIRLMEPGLNLVLALGERVSRLAGRDDDWEPPRGPVSGVGTPPSTASGAGRAANGAPGTSA